MNTPRIQVWLLPIDEKHETGWPDWERYLDAGERARAARLREASGHHHFIAAHGLLRALLHEAAGLAHDQWQLDADPHGRPLVAAGATHGNPPTISLSHTDGMVAAAVDCAGRPLGIDVEAVTRNMPLQVAQRILAPDELDTLSRLDDTHAADYLRRRWVLKEAVAKATGRGLAISVRRLCFADDAPPSLTFEPSADLGDPADWQVTLHEPGQHLVAVATAAGAEVDIHTINPLSDPISLLR